MSQACTRCDGTGLLNLHQLDAQPADNDLETVGAFLLWAESRPEPNDVGVCDCCGDGDEWYGTPGEHDVERVDPDGTIVYQGGAPECY